MTIPNSYGGLNPETTPPYFGAANHQPDPEVTGQRVLGLVEAQDRQPEADALSTPDNVHYLTPNIDLSDNAGQGTIYQRAPDTRENRLALFTGISESEKRIEFIERFSSDLLKLDLSRVKSNELATFCEAFPEWKYQTAIIKDKRYGIFRRVDANNLDLGAFAENGVERRVAWNAPEVVILVKDVYVRDLIKITDIEHYIETHLYVDEAVASEDLTAKAQNLSVTQRNIIKMLFSPACEIASSMDISESTVRTHIHNSMTALGLSNQKQLVLFGIQTGLVKLDHIEPGKTEGLSDKERKLLQQHYADTYSETAAALGLSVSTIRTHWHHIYAKLGAASRTQATVIAAKDGLIGLDGKTETAI